MRSALVVVCVVLGALACSVKRGDTPSGGTGGAGDGGNAAGVGGAAAGAEGGAPPNASGGAGGDSSAGDGGDAGAGDVTSAGAPGSSGGAGADAGTGGAAGAAGAGCGEFLPVSFSGPAVDIIVAVDNSGSMEDKSDAIEVGLNGAFAAALEAEQLDYRVILLSRHRKEPRTDSEAAATDICVSEPLSDLPVCPAPAPQASERFRHWDGKLESYDILDRFIDAFDTPPEVGSATEGYGAWLRPGARKVFIVFTDDDERLDPAEVPLTAEAFVAELTSLDPSSFGSSDHPTFGFHSVVGLVENVDPGAPYLPADPIVEDPCIGTGTTQEAGITYQELSVMMSGLRFPICNLAGYTTMFERLASELHSRVQLCDFALPDAALDPYELRLSFSDGSSTDLARSAMFEECVSNSFYVQDERVRLCPTTCDALLGDPDARVELRACAP